MGGGEASQGRGARVGGARGTDGGMGTSGLGLGVCVFLKLLGPRPGPHEGRLVSPRVFIECLRISNACVMRRVLA